MNQQPLYEDLRQGGLLTIPVEESAFTTFCRWQIVALIGAGIVVVMGLLRWPLMTLILLNGATTLVYALVVGFRFYTVLRGERLVDGALSEASRRPDVARDRDLPIYTILCPLYREAEVVEQFLRGMTALDYPFDKLDIRLILEADDAETLAAAQAATARMGNPDAIQILIAPDGQPRTKPRACNFGLIDARGEYVVIYDVEDIPDPDQLRRVLAAFRHVSEDTVCIQAKLNYFNPEQNLLTRFFTAEYSMWFDLFLPGLFAVDSPIPLGGTSNHFRLEMLRRFGAWDPFNVTEDADLGIRIARGGYRTAIIDSTTWEEANSRLGNWIRQRSRWVKGYMQVWLVSMRRPVHLFRALGFWRFLCFQLTVGGAPFVLLLNPIFWCLTVLYLFGVWDLVPDLFPPPVLALSLVTAIAGNLTFIYLSIYGLLKRESYGIVPLMFLSPLYWVLQSIAAWKALYQLLVKPHFWEKTTHNLFTAGPGGFRE